MAATINIVLAEMLLPELHWTTQNLSPIYRGKIGGKEDSQSGSDPGFRGRGLPFWKGSIGTRSR